jgi:hypothetical protein
MNTMSFISVTSSNTPELNTSSDILFKILNAGKKGDKGETWRG